MISVHVLAAALSLFCIIHQVSGYNPDAKQKLWGDASRIEYVLDENLSKQDRSDLKRRLDGFATLIGNIKDTDTPCIGFVPKNDRARTANNSFITFKLKGSVCGSYYSGNAGSRFNEIRLTSTYKGPCNLLKDQNGFNSAMFKRLGLMKQTNRPIRDAFVDTSTANWINCTGAQTLVAKFPDDSFYFRTPYNIMSALRVYTKRNFVLRKKIVETVNKKLVELGADVTDIVAMYNQKPSCSYFDIVNIRQAYCEDTEWLKDPKTLEHMVCIAKGKCSENPSETDFNYKKWVAF
ncbi:uncharacterized protein LOC141910545 [Tubulanus polymorphus]|uniref:uncharacterized protein LOC141910545 n=1 Tax=Tubulanus polymorphus TaxID=672921 RepID=UPI003DA3E5A7